MSFKDIALPYARLGIPVFPLLPKLKIPPSSMKDWQNLATIEIAQIEAWDAEDPDYNVGLVAKADGFLFFEFDIKGGMKQAAEEMGQPVPLTRLHVSGKGFAHWIFRQTERSRALGNRQANKPSGGEWFSFRQHNRYVVGPGSTHPNGSKYLVAPGRDIDPIPVPDWVCDWVEKHSRVEKGRVTGSLAVDEDFDFEDLMEHYGINIVVEDGNWYTPDVCPVAGYRHENSKHTGFYYDGEHLGWHCFAQGCAGSAMTIGGVLKHLNQTHLAYPQPIWPERDLDEFIQVDWVDAAEPAGEADLGALEDSLEPEEVAPIPEPPVVEMKELLDMLQGKPVEVVSKGKIGKLGPMPESCMYGWLGQKARELAVPLGFAYPAMLTAYCGYNIHMMQDTVRPTLYSCLIGPVHCGKSVAIDRATRSLTYSVKDAVVNETPGSDRGLYNLFGVPKSKAGEETVTILKTHLLAQDELRDTFGKISVQGSSLAPTLCKLWSKDEGGSADKTGVHRVMVRLSILGALKARDAEDFADVFGTQSNDGLYDRFIFGVIPRGWHWEPWEPNPEMRFPKGSTIPSHIYELLHAWRNAGTGDRARLGEIALRVALITACANRDHEVTEAGMRCALEFCEWQEQIRAKYQAGVALTLDAKCMEAVIGAFEQLEGSCPAFS